MNKLLLKLLLVTGVLILPVLAMAQEAGNAVVVPPGLEVSINIEVMGIAVMLILIVGGVIKNLTKLNNDVIPVVTWIGAALVYMLITKEWTDVKQWAVVLIIAATSTGLHSSTSSTTSLLGDIKKEGPLALFDPDKHQETEAQSKE